VNLFAIGVNHKTAPVAIRERLAVSTGPEHAEHLARLRELACVDEVMLLSTCNRVEVYACGSRTSPEILVNALATIRGIAPEALREHCFVNQREDAARHIFRVTASLESIVVGEPQILGQIKDAYQSALSSGTMGAVLGRCLTMAFHGAKRVRTETEIARGGASVPSVAVDLAGRIFGELRGAKALIVGAGDMARQTAVHLKTAGVAKIAVVNRSEARGRALAAEFEGDYFEWGGLEKQLVNADVVVASTGSPEAVIDLAVMKRVMRARRYAPIFMIDIAVPRDIEVGVNEVDGVFVYDVDDLRHLVDENLEGRKAQADIASRVLDEEISAFLAWSRERALGPMIKDLRQRHLDVAKSEIEKVMARIPNLSEHDRRLLSGLGPAIVNKFLHRPLTQLRASTVPGSGPDLVGAVQELFGLQQPQCEDPVAAATPEGNYERESCDV
jgi:glutamyl-tRNA reductase